MNRHVYIVDDDPDLRQSLHWMLTNAGFEVRTFATGQAFLGGFDPDLAGCLLLDIRMPELGGIELQRHIRRNGWALPIIMMTACADVPTAVTAIKEGAIDFIEKPFSRPKLIARVHEALTIVSREHDHRLECQSIAARMRTLTRREREVLDLLLEGRISKQIALELGCSVRTIESHRARVMHKMAVETVAELVRSALQARQSDARVVIAAPH